MSYRLKSILAASLLALAACTPPPEHRSGYGGAVVLEPSTGYGGGYAPTYGGGYGESSYRSGYGGSSRSNVVYGQVIGADRVGGGGGGGNDLAGAAIGGIPGYFSGKAEAQSDYTKLLALRRLGVQSPGEYDQAMLFPELAKRITTGARI